MSKTTLCLNPQRVFYPLKNIIVYLFLFTLTTGPGYCLHSASPQKENVLYILLAAEMAAHRQLPELALAYYLRAARISADPAVAEEATLLAVSLEAAEVATESAELWANKDPENLQAQLIATTLLISESKERAMIYLNRGIELDPQGVNHYVLEIQERLSPRSAENLRDILQQIATKRTSDPYAHLLAAESAAYQKDFSNAKRWVDSALHQKPDLTPAILLKAQLLDLETNSEQRGIQFLTSRLKQFPENQELRFYYAQILADNQQEEKAKEELSKLTQHSIFGGPALLILAEIYLKQNQEEKAYQTLEKATLIPQSKDGALYLLGHLDEEQQQPQKAIQRYVEVAPGPYHVPAILRAITLLKAAGAYKEALVVLHNSIPSTEEEQKYLLLAEIDILNHNQETEEAMQLANDILAKIPNDEDVLYLRAITATKLKRWDIAEMDLRKVIEQNPGNASALNALANILCSNQERLTDAIYYATQALNLAPTNPAFIYTTGWAYYRLGNFKQAIFYLKKAHELSTDSKIAAHYGEALWMDNEKTEAILVWKKAFKNNTHDEDLLDTLKRLNINLEQY